MHNAEARLHSSDYVNRTVFHSDLGLFGFRIISRSVTVALPGLIARQRADEESVMC